MKPTVYIDVIFLINFIINFLLLVAVAKFLKHKIKIYRQILASLVGALYAVFVFVPKISIIYSLFFKIVFSLVIVQIAFNNKNIKDFVKNVCAFYVVSFIFGGGAFALFYLTNAKSGLGYVLNYNVLYSYFPLKIFIISTLACYFLINIFIKIFIKKNDKKNLFYKANIYLDENKAECTMLLDTGNSLCEPIFGLPVIIVELSALNKILPDKIAFALNSLEENNFAYVANNILNSSLASRFRVIPFKSIGKDEGFLIGVKPDKVELFDGEAIKTINEVIIGIYNKKLSKNEDYTAIIGPNALNKS